jgi:DHA3 family macrolide efflux protein-like MFS transporter
MKSYVAPNLALSGMPAFTVIWLGQLVSLFGSSMTRFAIGVWLYQQTGLATTFATMIFFATLPRILLTPIAGVLVDRWNRKLTMMLSDLAAGITSILLLFLLQADSLEIWHIYALVAFSSAFESFQWPAYSSSITLMVDKKHYSRTNAMLEMARNGSAVVAPLLAAALLAVVEIEGIVIVDIITFLVAIGTLLIIAIPQPQQSETGKNARGGLLKEMLFGFRFILGNRSLLALQVNFFLINLMLGIGAALRTPMILARTANNELLLGTVLSIAAAGSVVGSIIVSAWGGPKRQIHGVLIGLLLGSFGLAIQGLGQELIVWSLGGFIIFFFLPMANASLQSIWQSKTPPDVQGTVFAARRLIGQGSLPIALLLAGPLSDNLAEPAMLEGGSLAPVFGSLVGTGQGAGMSLLIFFAGLVGIALPILAGYAIPLLRNLEDFVPDFDAIPSESTRQTLTLDDTSEKKSKAG